MKANVGAELLHWRRHQLHVAASIRVHYTNKHSLRSVQQTRHWTCCVTPARVRELWGGGAPYHPVIFCMNTINPVPFPAENNPSPNPSLPSHPLLFFGFLCLQLWLLLLLCSFKFIQELFTKRLTPWIYKSLVLRNRWVCFINCRAF